MYQATFPLLDEITAHRTANAAGRRRAKRNTYRAHRPALLAALAALIAQFFTT